MMIRNKSAENAKKQIQSDVIMCLHRFCIQSISILGVAIHTVKSTTQEASAQTERCQNLQTKIIRYQARVKETIEHTCLFLFPT